MGELSILAWVQEIPGILELIFHVFTSIAGILGQLLLEKFCGIVPQRAAPGADSRVAVRGCMRPAARGRR